MGIHKYIIIFYSCLFVIIIECCDLFLPVHTPCLRVNHFLRLIIINAINQGIIENPQAIKIVCKRGSIEVESVETFGMVFDSC